MSPLEVIVSETLEQLDMGYCNINTLPLHTFSSVPSLRHLILDGNSIQTIEYNVLPKGLTYINLAFNHIVEPPINVFNSLRYLFRLDISHNPINCSCALLAFQDSLSGRAGILENGVTCANPPHLVGRNINSVNENQLCRHDYDKKEGANSLAHSRRYHHHQYDIQSDEPLMGDESYGTRDHAEVMFTNDETNQMGTHMEARMGTYPGDSYSQTAGDNKLETMEGTTIINDKDDASPEAEPPQDLTVDHHPSSPEEVEENGTSPEELAHETSPDEHTAPQSSMAEEDLHHATEESYSGNDNIINLSSSDPSGGTSDHSNTLHALDVGYNGTDSNSPTEETDVHKWHTPEVESDAELLANSTLGNEPSSNLKLAYTDTTTDSSTSDKQFTLPTSATEPADYSYDTQHDDYGVVDNVTSSEVTDEESPTVLVVSSSTSSTPEEVEGSGEPETDTTTEYSPSSSTVGFMEEQETETEPSLQTVSDDLADVSSTTTYDGLLSSSSETPSSTEPSTEPEPSSSETSSVEPSSEPSSTEPSTEPDITEPSPVSSTDQSSTPEEVTEEPTTEASTELQIVETSSETSTTVQATEMSPTSETPSSSSSESPRGFWWDSDEEMSPSSSAATPSEDASSAATPSEDASSAATPSEDTTSEVSHTGRKGKMIESTTEGDKDNEILILDSVEGEAKNGKIMDSSQSKDEHNYLTAGLTFILIGVLIAVVMILLTIIMCRKKKTTKKVRLPPVDPEAANGTELQDMLLPKPPENGIKVLPKAYTNGTNPVSNGNAKEPEADKEETIPVLAPEPEPEPVWDDKPEPIEAVTARLTMLARPQTPIFIQKSLT